jgi:hypothetical protein
LILFVTSVSSPFSKSNVVKVFGSSSSLRRVVSDELAASGAAEPAEGLCFSEGRASWTWSEERRSGTEGAETIGDCDSTCGLDFAGFLPSLLLDPAEARFRGGI